jgi:aminodeoxyfutalosine deaminase
MILRARVVVPMSRPPISDGAVLVSDDRIRSVGTWRQLSAHRNEPVFDLGEAALLPGLINAHCHLDYTHMAGQFTSPKLFIDWLKLITTTKSQWSMEEYTASWQSGAAMLLRTGTTTVADIEAVPELLPQVWDSTPLRVISFLELIGITARRPPERVLQEVLDKIQGLPRNRCQIGLSPHAPYSTVPRLLRQTAEIAKREGWLLCTHVAESKSEYLMFAKGRGDMFDWLQRSGREMSDCGLGSPVRHLDSCGALGENLLATHVNYLARGDAALLAGRKVSVIHCPRSHSYFGHETFPLRRLLRAGVNVCLGTDSLASVTKNRAQAVELDMLAEMRTLADRHRWLSSKAILRMGTLNSARALARPKAVGRLTPGALADLIAIPAIARPGKVYDRILEHKGAVSASMIGGVWAIPPS